MRAKFDLFVKLCYTFFQKGGLPCQHLSVEDNLERQARTLRTQHSQTIGIVLGALRQYVHLAKGDVL